MSNIIKAFSPATAWSLLILYLSTRGNVSSPFTWVDFIGWDKLGHAGFYCILAFTFFWGLSRINRMNQKTIALSLLFCGLYGILLEFIQFYYFPGRYFEVLDIVANIIGVMSSLVFKRYFLV